MTPAEYEFLSSMLLQRSGLVLGESKEYLLEARLLPLAQSWGLNSTSDLVTELQRGPNERLASAITEAMTTNETLFFRDKTPFDELKSHMLPALYEARRATRHLRIWSAAASTGQEAYSIAITLRENMPGMADWRTEILGTDISSQALARAESGVYSQFEVQRGMPIQVLMKYFKQMPQGWQINDQIRGMTSFQKLNLHDRFQQLGLFDIIFCRNVLIYFETSAKKQILERMVRVLRPDGYLVLGAAETTLGITDSLRRRGDLKSAVYVHPQSAAAFAGVLS